MARRSLALRLVLSAGAWTAAALVAGGIVLSGAFREAVERNFDQRLAILLDGLIAVAEIGADGRPALMRAVGEPRFDQPLSGWYWQIAAGGAALTRSRSLWDEALPAGPSAAGGPWNATGPEDQRLRLFERDIALPGAGERFRFTVAGERSEIDRAVGAFNATLIWSLGALGVGLLLAMLIQVRFGLTPLRRIREAIVAVRAGRAQRLEGDFPVEIAPLSDELNTLLEHNAAVLERARTQASNLAHALKTPLAVLNNEAAGAAGPLAETVRRQTAVMQAQIDHHLARARTAASARVLGARVPVADVVEGLRRTLARIHQDRGIAIETAIPPALAFRGERQDLEEMLGNLADNACKWARRRVRIEARREGERILCAVEDDGPGLSPDERRAVFSRGRRLDESVPGSGHGLAIVREIAELYDGSVALDDSGLGGLKAALALPAAPEI